MSILEPRPSGPPALEVVSGELVAAGDLAELVQDWVRALRAERKSPATIGTYMEGVKQFYAFLVETNRPTNVRAVTADTVRRFINHLQDTGRSPGTISVRYMALRGLFKFAVAEGELEANPLLGPDGTPRVKPPAMPEPETPVLTDDELRALLDACSGRRFEDRRDLALIRLLIDTGCRNAEVTSLRVDDVDRDQQSISVLGKGSKPRIVLYGAKCALALDRYWRARKLHRLAGSPALWLGLHGPITTGGLRGILDARGRQAGIGHVHPHQLRHTAVDAWLSAGGSEGDAIRLFGWSNRTQLERYGKARAVARAHESYRRLSPGDRL